MDEAKQNKFDITIVGGGAGGYTAAFEAVKRGMKTALIERDSVGGTCLNRGCVPTQCLLRDLIDYSDGLSSALFPGRSPVSPDALLKKIQARRDEIVMNLVEGTEKTLISQGVHLFKEKARFLEPHKVALEPSGTVVESTYTIIATGSIAEPPVPLEYDHETVLHTNDALKIESVPKSIAVVGSGHRSMAFANIFRYLGSEVTIITEDDGVLPDADREIASRYRKVLKSNGIGIFAKSAVCVRIDRKDGGLLALTVASSKGESVVEVEKVLVPGKRRANVLGLDIGRIGITLKDRAIPVDEGLMTSAENTFAIGDTNGNVFAASRAMAQGTMAVDRIHGENVHFQEELVPMCQFTKPEVSWVGLTERDAKTKHENVEVGYFLFAAGSRPNIFRETEGLIKIVFEKRYGEVLGVHIIGPQAAELISLASMAMKNELGLEEIRSVIFPHPSFGENFLDAVKDGTGAIRALKNS